MKKKSLAVGIILLFVGTCVIPAIAQITEKPLPISDGKWLYVGGSGPGNYTRIQDAIDNATDGDTVFVYKGIYIENLTINKSLTLLGQDRNLTQIHTQGCPVSILIQADEVTISGFTIIKSSEEIPGATIRLFLSYDVTINNNIIEGKNLGIDASQSSDLTFSRNIISKHQEAIYCIQTSNINISENNISNNGEGINLRLCSNCQISNNLIHYNNYSGVIFDTSYHFIVVNNSIMFNKHGGLLIRYCDGCSVILNHISSNNELNMYLTMSSQAIVKHNIIENAIVGLSLYSCPSTLLLENSVYNHTSYGLKDWGSERIDVIRNNFRNNKPHASFRDSFIIWNGNYWGRPMFHPKLIIGERLINIFNRNLSFPIINADWYPAKTPNDFEG